MSYATTTELAVLLGRDLSTEEEAKATVCLEIVDAAIDGYLNGRTAATGTKSAVAKLAGRRLLLDPVGVQMEMLGDWQAMYRASELLSADEKMLLDAGVTRPEGTRRRSTGSPRLASDIWEPVLTEPTT